MTNEERKEYELALKIGKKRFGSPCSHEKVKNGVCINCLRKVIKTCFDCNEFNFNCCKGYENCYRKREK